MKKLFAITFALFCVCAAWCAQPKYIFLFIGDGMSTPQRMIADEFSRHAGHGRLILNTLPYHATTRTCSSSSLVTDSAAAATAIACGEKTNNGRIGVDAEGVRRLESVAEAAKKKGRKVGIVTTVTINHATPAGFYGHRKSRSEGYALGLDMIASGFDYFAGGGVFGSNDGKAPEYKGKSIYALAEEAGYTLTVGRDALMKLKPGRKVYARSENNDAVMPYTIDADPALPTLADFTAKGIELLDNPNGFFMMIEGGKIDYAGHANDAATNLREVLGLDKAVQVALAFAAKHPAETLVIVTGDHETGGMTMGFAATGYALYMDRLANQKCSVDVFGKKVRAVLTAKPDLAFDAVKPMLTESFGFLFTGKDPMTLTAGELKELEQAFQADAKALTGQSSKWNSKLALTAKKIMSAKSGVGWTPMTLTAGELKELEQAFQADARALTGQSSKWNSKLALTAKKIMSAKSGVGWTSGAHTALPVLTTSQGVGAENFTGFLDNTDLAKKLKDLL